MKAAPLPSSRRWRAALAGISLLAAGLALGGCSWLGLGDDDTAANNDNKDAANYRERPI